MNPYQLEADFLGEYTYHFKIKNIFISSPQSSCVAFSKLIMPQHPVSMSIK